MYKKTCAKCCNTFAYSQKDTVMNFQGTEPAKVVKCQYCNTFNLIEYWIDNNLDVNNDERYYMYN